MAIQKTLLVAFTLAGLFFCNPSVHAMVDGGEAPRAIQSISIGAQAPHINFAKSIEELPLMGGLTLVPEDDVLFVFGSDRIAQATAKGLVDIDSVYYHYQKILPTFGWIEITPRLYERSGERLHVNVSSANKQGVTFVRFTLEPTGGR